MIVSSHFQKMLNIFVRCRLFLNQISRDLSSLEIAKHTILFLNGHGINLHGCQALLKTNILKLKTDNLAAMIICRGVTGYHILCGQLVRRPSILPKTGWAIVHPAHPPVTPLICYECKKKNILIFLIFSASTFITSIEGCD